MAGVADLPFAHSCERLPEQHGIRVVIVTLPYASEKDAESGVWRAALFEQADGLVEVDAYVRRKSFGVGTAVPRSLELVDTPLNDVVVLRLVRDLEPLHIFDFPSRGRPQTSVPFRPAVPHRSKAPTDL